MEVRKAGDFGFHHQRFNLPVQCKVSSSTGAVEVSLAKPFDLDLSNELADPLASTRLLCLEPNAGCRLGQHDFSKVTVQVFKLRFPLEAQNHRVLALPIFGNGGVELRQLLQTCQLVDHKPCSLLSVLGLVQETQNEQIDPQTLKRTKGFAFRRK